MKTENIFGVEVSEDVFTTEFSCDYDVCKGACCYSPLPSGSKVHAVGGGLTKDEYAEVLDRKKDIAQYVAPEMAKSFIAALRVSGILRKVSLNMRWRRTKGWCACCPVWTGDAVQ